MVLCVLEKWYKVIRFLTWILMGSMCLLIGFQILNRFAFHIPAAWTEEFCRYNFVWLTMVASAKAMHDRQQLAVDIMPYLLAHKPMLKNSIKLFAQILALFFLAIIFKQTSTLLSKQYWHFLPYCQSTNIVCLYNPSNRILVHVPFRVK
ncbi:TRAP transporter small permease [Cloacibacillus evryensis]